MSKSKRSSETLGGHSDSSNELLIQRADYSDFPYDTVTVKEIKQLTAMAVERAHDLIEYAATSETLTWDTVVEPITRAGEELCTLYGPLYLSSYVSTKKKIRRAASDAMLEIGQLDTVMMHRTDLYENFREYSVSTEAQTLDDERSRYLDLTIRAFKANGHGLAPEDKARLLELSSQILEYEGQFNQGIGEDKTTLLLGKKALMGLSQEFLDSLEVKKKGKYKLNMTPEHIYTILEDSPNRETRRKIGIAQGMVAVNTNKPLLEKMITTRQEIARLLGYDSWAHYRLEQCIVSTPEKVKEFYSQLIEVFQPQAQAEIDIMTEQLRVDGFQDGLKQHDVLYYASHHTEHADIDKRRKILEYFPVESVRDGIFELSEKLFGLTYKPKQDAVVWHEDVQVYDVYEADTHVSTLYLDLFVRPGKDGGTYQLPIRAGKTMPDGTVLPSISAVMADFVSSERYSASLLSLEEIHDFMHEMGHFFAAAKARTQIAEFSVGDDAGLFLGKDYAEMTAQVFEKWAEEPQILSKISSHYQTGEKIPVEQIERHMNDQKRNQALQKLGRFALHYTDLLFHDGSMGNDLEQILEETAKITLLPHEPGTFYPARISHFADYSAQMSTYDVSDVIAYDIFESRFRKAGLRNSRVGRDFARGVLSPGGTQNPAELVRRFLGRDFTTRAYLARLSTENI